MSRDTLVPNPKWYVYDGLGSVLSEVDEDGNVGVARSHHAFGAVRSSVGVSESKNGFVGSLGHALEADATGGLIYMRARWYDPAIARFISEDPYLAGENWHSYCENSPAMLFDPSGQWPTMEQVYDFLGRVDGNLLQFIGGLLQTAGAGMMAAGAAMCKKGLREKLLGQLTQLARNAATHPFLVMLADAAGKMVEAKGARTVRRGVTLMAEGAVVTYLGTVVYTLGEDAKDLFQ